MESTDRDLDLRRAFTTTCISITTTSISTTATGTIVFAHGAFPLQKLDFVRRGWAGWIGSHAHHYFRRGRRRRRGRIESRGLVGETHQRGLLGPDLASCHDSGVHLHVFAG